jgi:hypothetical protein
MPIPIRCEPIKLRLQFSPCLLHTVLLQSQRFLPSLYFGNKVVGLVSPLHEVSCTDTKVLGLGIDFLAELIEAISCLRQCLQDNCASGAQPLVAFLQGKQDTYDAFEVGVRSYAASLRGCAGILDTIFEDLFAIYELISTNFGLSLEILKFLDDFS